MLSAKREIKMRKFRMIFPIILIVLLPSGLLAQGIVADHNVIDEFEDIPDSYITQVKDDFKIAYGHTSHGSQPITGMTVLQEQFGAAFNFTRVEYGCNADTFICDRYPAGDLGHTGDLTWETNTRNLLNNHPEYQRNVVIWSWCGGVSDNTVDGINTYLTAMDQLEQDYPEVTFVYMTGHLWNGVIGTRANTDARNLQIRNWAKANNKILFDFADIESWDPDGGDHRDDTDACQWCSDYCADHPEIPSCNVSTCSTYYCRHSHCFNCYQKGKAFWWMLARMAGWPGPITSDDTTPPANITSLNADSCNSDSCNLSWTAPGDDGNIGTATAYEMRYSTTSITADNFGSAHAVSGEPAPEAAGTEQSLTVSGLNEGTLYYFAIRTRDEASNWSGISNVASRQTDIIEDTTAPSAVSDLSIVSHSYNSCTLRWHSPGDDGDTGTATAYEMRYSTSPITQDNFPSAQSVTGEPLPQVAGTVQSITVGGLAAQNRYYFAIKSRDEVSNWSLISNVVDQLTDEAPDTAAPEQITDLTGLDCDEISCTLSWSAPGDDGNSGQASAYEIRYSGGPINSDNFSQATLAQNPPPPAPAGTEQSYMVSELASNTRYYFAIRTADEVPNFSPISNVISEVTDESVIPDTTPPVISSIYPSGILPVGTSSVNASMNTNEPAECRYSIDISADFTMMSEAESTNGTYHSFVIDGLNEGNDYTYYLKCRDLDSNEQSAEISFTVDEDKESDVNTQIEAGARGYMVSGGCGTVENRPKRNSIPLLFTISLILGMILFLSSSVLISHNINEKDET